MPNAVTFVPEKTEIVHFIGKRKDLLERLPSMRYDEREICCKEAICWLGDPDLNFSRYIKKCSATTKRTVQHLR